MECHTIRIATDVSTGTSVRWRPDEAAVFVVVGIIFIVGVIKAMAMELLSPIQSLHLNLSFRFSWFLSGFPIQLAEAGPVGLLLDDGDQLSRRKSRGGGGSDIYFDIYIDSYIDNSQIYGASSRSIERHFFV